ncbi:hypothetical protein KCU_11398 [Pasteurella multocida subsp. multocida str. P52VAC]|nr:hypothetical protein KCU_11398 [Pasteurella multocida subsp. multocida str. P52VAC]
MFIYRDVYDTHQFIEEQILQLGIHDYKLVCLPSETLGQAETVYQGIYDIDSDEELLYF